jgi:hypothetical protein
MGIGDQDYNNPGCSAPQTITYGTSGYLTGHSIDYNTGYWSPWYLQPAQNSVQDIDVLRALQKVKEEYEKFFKENKKDKEVDIMFLYRVYLIYAEDRKNPMIVTTGSTVAKDDDDAKVKSGVYAKILPDWDADYITVVVEKVGEVKVKPKPQEVKTV